MKILLKNATLISMSDKRKKYENNMDILICENKIRKIDKNISVNKEVKIIDCNEKIVLPGFVNTHSHMPMSIFRETVDGYKLQKWLEDKIWPMEDKLKSDDIYFATYLSCIEMIKSGLTTINDMYFMTENIIKAAIESGIRLQTTRTLISGQNDFEERLKYLDKIIEDNKNNKQISFNVGIHGLYTTKKEDLINAINYAKNKNLRIHMHFCENSNELQDIKKLYNVSSPIDVIEKYFNSHPLILAHCVNLKDNEIERISKFKNIFISHCPISNLRLGCGIAKINKMMEYNMNISLGTDGQGSGSSLDMFETMKFTGLLQKGVNEDPTCICSYDLLKMVTINGAKALGLENEIGSIDENKIADIIIINPKTEQMQPLNDIFSDIVYNAKSFNVETTIINGKILMENRKMTFCDENKIYEKCKEIILKIK